MTSNPILGENIYNPPHFNFNINDGVTEYALLIRDGNWYPWGGDMPPALRLRLEFCPLSPSLSPLRVLIPCGDLDFRGFL